MSAALIEAARAALEALLLESTSPPIPETAAAIADLRTALAAAERPDATERAHELAQAFSRGHDAGWTSAKAQPVGEPVKVWCETCDGSGKVYQEHPMGCWVGGDHACPDCNGKGYVLCEHTLFHAAPAAAEQPAEPAPHAMQQLTAALEADPDYAWSWHCNLAMPVMDATGVTHRAANEAGARLMRHLFDIDITKHPHYSVRAASPAAPAQAPLPHLKAAADAVMAHQWSNSREAMQALTELIEAALAHGIGSKA